MSLKNDLLLKNNVSYAYADPVAKMDNVVRGSHYRLTVVTDRLFRIECSKTGEFCDDMTQMVINRASEKVPFMLERDEETVRITTKRCVIVFSIKKGKLISASLDGKKLPIKNKGNLGGTCRTLDNRIGRVKLDLGVVSKSGAAYIEDDSLPLLPDGTIGKRRENYSDTYAFLYGHEYRDALQALFFLTGPVPMLPRYVLSNWWSRFRAYTQKEYLDLMDRFEKEDLPFAVATVDMDWHWVDVDKRFGEKPRPFPFSAGWTGYSWNTDLFPDYRAFLNELHKKNMHVTLNLHPADGVRKFEVQYEEMANYLGRAADGTPIPFDLSDPDFINAYFDVLHRPFEKEGVDFWWIDWQQGKKSTVENLDPLWALNHYHYLDNGENKRGLILSRYAKIGSHRYPLGFSGDAMTYWSSLRFQPYMTSTATNVGYTWWSHDTGGHNFGVYSDELYLRWLQFGVFSPINRLHSTSHDLQGKEPWKHSETVRRIACDYLRLRHSLLPYLYTAMRKTAMEGVALCEPVYYRYPEQKEAYQVKNEYFFGESLLVCPITSPTLKSLNMGKTEMYIPEGRYTDLFTGKVYHGGKKLTVFRDIEYIPVLAKAGAIIPLSRDGGNSCDNPKSLELLVYRGNDSYTMYEDDGLTNDYASGKYAETTFVVTDDGNKVTFSIKKPTVKNGFSLPKDRVYYVSFKDVARGNARLNGVFTTFDGTCTVKMKAGDVVEIVDAEYPEQEEKTDAIRLVLSRYQGSTLKKMLRYWDGKYIKNADELMKFVKRRFPKDVYLACLEAIE